MTPPGPARAPHLEDVREVAVETQGDRRVDSLQRVIRHAHALDTGSIPQHARSEYVKQSPRDRHLPVLPHDVGIRQVCGKDRVVLADRGTEEQRLTVAEEQFTCREKARSRVIQTVLAGCRGTAGRHVDRIRRTCRRISAREAVPWTGRSR